jgi:methyl-accepting chemotaxis protein
MSIRLKLIILSCVTLIGLGIVLTVVFVGLNVIHEAEDTAHRRESYVIDLMEIKASALSSIMLDPALSETKVVFSDAEKNISIHSDRAIKAIKRDSVREELKKILEQWNTYDQASQALIKLAVTDLKSANDKLVPLYNQQFKPFQNNLEKFANTREEEADQSRAQADETFHRIYGIAIVTGLLATTVIILVVLNLAMTLQKGLRAIHDKLLPLKEGDLTQRLPENSKDELGEIGIGVNAFIHELQVIVQKTHEQSNQVDSSALQLASASAHVRSSSIQQSEATSSVASSIEQLSVSIDQVSESATAAKQTADFSGDTSTIGSTEVASAIAEIKNIEHVVNGALNQIESLGKKAIEITSIVNSIKDVADQTNLLALNAAIEAARAGEQGRGFAVVADEVRKLAERTAQSAQEITQMIGSIQTEAESSTKVMREGYALVAQGVSKTEHAGESMHKIKESSADVIKAIGDITIALSEQRIASSDIAKNVEQIAHMTEENSAAVSEVSVAAESLKKIADELHQEVTKFKV